MDEARNPFQLHRRAHAELPGRGRELDTIVELLEQLAAGGRDAVLFSGRSGVGTSSLVHAIDGRVTARDWHWGVAEVVAGDPLREAVGQAFASALRSFAARRPGAAGLRTASDAVAGFVPSVVDVLPVPVSHEALAVPRGDLARDLRRLLAAVADSQRDLVGRGVLVALDELHRAVPEDAVAVVRVFADAMQDGQPVGLVAAGTPTLRWFAAEAGAAVGVVEVGPLPAADVVAFLVEQAQEAGADLTTAAAAAIARATAGYPALVALYAHAAWNAATGDVVDEDAVAAGAPVARELLARRVLAPACDVSAAARRYLRVVAEADDPVDSADIARRLGDTTRFGSGASQLGMLRDDLVRRGVLATADGSRLTFAHPAACSYVLSWE